MLSLTVLNTPKPLFLSTTFLPNSHHPPPTPPPLLTPHKTPNKSFSITALILPNSSSTSSKQQQQLYQPYRPPPSPIPAKYRSLDTNGRLEILTNRMGLWFEYAPLINALHQEGFISTTLEEITGIPSRQQNTLVVATQIRDTLIESTDAETVSYFDSANSPEILYGIRILNTAQRVAAARFIIANEYDDAKKADELARSMKDFPRRVGERGWESFDRDLPGDCLAYMYFRQAQEHKSASFLELSKAALERALEVAQSERAKNRVMDDLEGKDGESNRDGGLNLDDLVRVPVVRMAIGEVAESSSVVVLPVCRSEEREMEVEQAPWDCGMVGDFGVVMAEKGWSQWVVLPGWGPVVALRKGGAAVLFPKARGVLPWKNKRKDVEESIMVVVDRERKEVEFDDAFYLVLSGGGGNGSGGEGLRVQRGVTLKEMKVGESLGTVVLVVRPPREEYDDQLGDEDWV